MCPAVPNSLSDGTLVPQKILLDTFCGNTNSFIPFTNTAFCVDLAKFEYWPRQPQVDYVELPQVDYVELHEGGPTYSLKYGFLIDFVVLSWCSLILQGQCKML